MRGPVTCRPIQPSWTRLVSTARHTLSQILGAKSRARIVYVLSDCALGYLAVRANGAVNRCVADADV
jgi:hypothetical protein